MVFWLVVNKLIDRFLLLWGAKCMVFVVFDELVNLYVW